MTEEYMKLSEFNEFKTKLNTVLAKLGAENRELQKKVEIQL